MSSWSFAQTCWSRPRRDAAFPEDAWVGCVLRIGDMRLRVDKRDQRCVMVNVDPRSTDRHPGILRAIARERQACLGVYGSTVQPGRVAISDRICIEDAGSPDAT